MLCIHGVHTSIYVYVPYLLWRVICEMCMGQAWESKSSQDDATLQPSLQWRVERRHFCTTVVTLALLLLMLVPLLLVPLLLPVTPAHRRALVLITLHSPFTPLDLTHRHTYILPSTVH